MVGILRVDSRQCSSCRRVPDKGNEQQNNHCVEPSAQEKKTCLVPATLLWILAVDDHRLEHSATLPRQSCRIARLTATRPDHSRTLTTNASNSVDKVYGLNLMTRQLAATKPQLQTLQRPAPWSPTRSCQSPAACPCMWDMHNEG